MEARTYRLPDDSEILIRPAGISDAEELLDYVEAVSRESEFLTFGPGEFGLTVEKERDYLTAVLAASNELYLVASDGGRLVGTLNFKAGPRSRTKHAGEFGISVRKSEWGRGIGSALIDVLVAWAGSAGTIRKIDLRVRVDNARAIRLYRDKGFEVEGRLRDELFVNGRYYDLYAMGLVIQR